MSTRASRDDAWSPPVAIAELNTTSAETDPTTDAALLHIVFHRRDGDASLWEATRTSSKSAWRKPRELTELETGGDEMQPHLDPSGTVLYFSARRRAGDLDIFRTTRASVDEPFGAAELVAELVSTGDDVDAWMSPDGHTILFASNRSGNTEIYAATR
jgi:hypothetical protein